MNKLQIQIRNYTSTLEQLEANTYENLMSNCDKCKTIGANWKSVHNRCVGCPESIHNAYQGCALRYTKSRMSIRSNNELSITYHKQAIKWLGLRSRYNHKMFQAELLRLDKHIKLNK